MSDLSEFEFTVALTCEVSGHHDEPVRAIRYLVMGCPRCHHTATPPIAVCGDCYVKALRYRSSSAGEGQLILCSGCGHAHSPITHVQFYDPRTLGVHVSP